MLLPSANPFIAPHWLPNQVQASPRVSGHSLTFLTLNPRESDSESGSHYFFCFLPSYPCALVCISPLLGLPYPILQHLHLWASYLFQRCCSLKPLKWGSLSSTSLNSEAYLLPNARLPVLWWIVSASYLLRCGELTEGADGTWDLGYIVSYRRGPSAHLGTQAKRGACHLCTLWFFTMPATCTFSSVLALLSTEAALASLTWPHIWHFTMMRPKPKKYHKETTGQYF